MPRLAEVLLLAGGKDSLWLSQQFAPGGCLESARALGISATDWNPFQPRVAPSCIAVPHAPAGSLTTPTPTTLGWGRQTPPMGSIPLSAAT